MHFYDKFNKIENDELLLNIIEKNTGDDKIIPFYYFDIIRKNDNKPIGKISARIGHNFHSYYNGNIGYEIFKEYRGNSFAYKACVMLLEIFKAHNMEFIYLACSEGNIASYKTIERLGAELVEICNVPKDYFAWREGMEKQRIYRLTLR